MCGIAGKFYFNKNIFYDDIGSILQSIVHRGPDSEGRFSDGRVLFGFRRLSIIDTFSGDQPLFSEGGEIILIANGEIYNYKELKNFLKSKGHQFRTGSDCEVIVHLYEEFGQNFVHRLNGMFAFCLYDRRQERLFLCRDRVGIKPLYFARREGVLIFASEIKAILQAAEVDSVENQGVLDEYLCFRSLAGTRTFFAGINLLGPGMIMEVNPAGTKSERFWKPSPQASHVHWRETVPLIQETLHASVQRQLMADVPLGTQLSGGVDSSWVSVLASREAPGMKSFSVGFSEQGFDETPEAKEVAASANLEYHEVASNPAVFCASLPRVIWHNDEPLTHANSVEIHHLCRYAQHHVKALLTGEGADELFGGYPRYYLCRLGETYGRLPAILRPFFRLGLDWVSRERGKKPGNFLGMSKNDLVFWNPVFAISEKVAWLSDRNELDLRERRTLLDDCWRDSRSLLDNLLVYEFETYLQPILLRQDKMSMGASVEARVPILDNAMVDLAFSIPASEKIRNLQPKYLFKLAGSRDLPKKIVYKRKVGFGVPVGAWMRANGSLEKGLDHILDARHSLLGINPHKLERIILEHREGLADHQDLLWPLLNYLMWKDIFLKG